MTSTHYKLLLIVILLTSCHSEPNIPYTPQEKNVSIAYLKSLYNGYPHKIAEDICVEGILRSNDVDGNFYKTMVFEDQTGGIDLKVDMENIFIHYYRGRKYIIRCNGLTLGSYGGTMQLGYESNSADYQIGAIPQEMITTHLSQISDEEYPLAPPMLEIDRLSPAYISRWVGLNPVQFTEEELDMAWTENSLSTARHLIDMRGDTLHVYTSFAAKYAEHMLPRGSGHIEGILGYFNLEYQLRLTTLYYVMLDQPRFKVADSEKITHSLVAEHPTACPLAPEYDIR